MPRIAFLTAPSATVPGALLAGLRACWTAIRRGHRRRVAAATLHRLSDHHLADIGISRDQIEAAVRGLPGSD